MRGMRKIGVDHNTNADLNDPLNLRLFARGLLKALCDACIDINSPEMFEQWSNAAQRHQRNRLCKQAIHDKYGSSQPLQRSNNQGSQQHNNNRFSNFFWCRSGQSSNSNLNNCRSSGPARPCLPPRNDNAMDMSATVRKATTEKDKEEYRKAGRCFECGKQGHLARTCPSKKPQQNQNAHMVTIEDNVSGDMSIDSSSNSSFTPTTLAALAMRLSDEEKGTFAHKPQEMGANVGFQDA